MNAPKLFERAVVITAAALIAGCSSQQVQTAPGPGHTGHDITAADLRTRLYIYADDSMMGRETGTVGNMMATRYIEGEVRRLGLEPAGENGTYFQESHATSTRYTGGPPGTARNVIAIVRGSDPVLRDEFVAIGAHNDHLGIRHPAVDHDSLIAVHEMFDKLGIPSWDRTFRAQRDSLLKTTVHVNMDSLHKIRPAILDSIANGADDDGSGTVTVLELAEYFATAKVKPKRSILFVWHTGEEKGLLGSKWFTEHPTVPRDKIVAQLNMDMVGRGSATDIKGGGPYYLQLVGSRRVSTELGDIVEQVNSKREHPFKFDYQYDANGHPERIYCRSDHYNYARYGIPITFFTTGLHDDYHQVTDEPNRIDYDHMARIGNFVRDIATTVANLDHRPKVDKPVPSDPMAACVQ